MLATEPYRSNFTNFKTLIASSLIAGVVALAVCTGFWAGRAPSQPNLPTLHAATSAASNTMAVATGQISNDAEGIFFLDFITGDLQCLLYYPRSGAFGARYYTNVRQQLLGGGKNSQYLLVTGSAVSIGSTGGARPANSLVYVTDVTTGMFAAYTVPFDRTAEASGTPQSGPLVFIGGGPIRNYQLRNQDADKPAAVVQPKKK